MTHSDRDFVGVFDTPDPAQSLRAFGIPVAYQDTRVAFGGAPVWQDQESGLVVSGVFVPNNDAPACARKLDLALDTPSLALVATLFARHGAMAGRLAPGVFAGAVWDSRRGILTLLRDAVGIRTLYYAGSAGSRGFWFAAQLRQLRRAPVVSNTLSLPALRDYLVCSYVPGERTMWQDIRELRPGVALHLPEQRKETYWRPKEGPEADAAAPMAEYSARLRPELDDAVRRCLPTPQTPVGVYLSGGVDSSLVTAIAARQCTENGASPLYSYAIHFGSEYANELNFSEMVARHCGTRHKVLELPAPLIQKHLAESIATLDDPIGDPLTVPNLLLGKAARADVGIILNGEGGDPLFGGPKNGPMLLHELYDGGDEAGRIDAYFRSYQKCYDDLPRLLTPDTQRALATAPALRALLDPFLADDHATMRQYLNRLMQINVDLKGADQILTKVYNLTSACGLRGESPLFDVRVAEAAFAIPAVYKRAGAAEKAVLKDAVADLLPEPILTRPKSGMMVPVQRWFQNDLRKYATSLLLSRQSRIRPYLRQELIKEWLDYRTHQPFARQGVKLWLCLTLEIWLRENEK